MPDAQPLGAPKLAFIWLFVVIFCAFAGRLEAQTTQVVSDNFNRPNSFTLGPNWAYPIASETTFIVTNDMVETFASEAHCEACWKPGLTNFSNNQYSQILLTSIGPWTGVVLRADTNVDEFYFGFVYGPNDYRIYARYGYTNVYQYFSLATGSAVTWQVGDTMKLAVSGTNDPVTITMYRNNTPVLVWRSSPGTDPFPVKNGGSPGIGMYSRSGAYLTLDNFQGGNLNQDTNPPSAPTNLTATPVNQVGLNLSWQASTDNVQVVGYEVDSSIGLGSTNFTQVGVSTGTNFTDPNMTGTTNNYLVMALDAAGNESPYAEVTALVPTAPLPTVSTLTNQTTLTGIAVGPFAFYISDGGIDPDSLVVTATSSNTNLVPNQNLLIDDLGPLQLLTMVPASGQTGISTITVNVSNGEDSTNVSFLLTVNPPGNGTGLFANTSNVAIASQSGGSPYPSSINVSGDPGVITNVMVTFNGLSYNDPGNLNVLLVSPSGQAVVLLSDAIGYNLMNNITFTLSSQAPYPVAGGAPLPDGTYQPADYAPDHTDPAYSFPSPAPAPPYSEGLSSFDGASPNGTWSLYISDGGYGDSGQIAGGWSLAITTISLPMISGLTNQSTSVNTPPPPMPFQVSDAQTPASNLVLMVQSSNPALVNPATDIIIGGSGSNSTITITPELNTIGTSIISVIVTDNSGMSTTNSFLMTVNQGQLTVSGITASNKVYDGTMTATLNFAAANLSGQGLSGSDATLDISSATGTFADQNVGTNKAVQISGLALDGSDAGNYALVQPAALANITSKMARITAGLTANPKVYDGTTAATISSNAVVLGGVVTGDAGNVNLSTNGYVATFANINVGTNIAVSVSGLNLTGSVSGNYVLCVPGLATNITPATLTVSAGNFSRTFGLPNPPLTVSYSGFVNGEGTNVLTGAPGLSTVATNCSPPAAYAITVAAGTLSATNYSFNLVDGTLTVVALPQLSTVAISGCQLAFSWPTITNQSYEFETTTDLDAAWTPMGNTVAGTGDLITVTNALDLPQQFFRLSITQ